jgi:hypothetical protein
MWKRAAIVLLFLLGGNTNAQTAEESNPSAPESLCFQVALVELACSKLSEYSAQPPTCLEARVAQQKCLKQAQPEASAGPNDRPSASGAASPALPAAPPQSFPQGPVLQRPGRANSSEGSANGVHDTKLNSDPRISPKANSANVDRPAVDDEPVAAIRSDTAKNEAPAPGNGGVVNETRTPLDNPRVIAVIHSTSNVKDSPNTLEIRCQAQRTELALSTDGAWVAPDNGIQVDYQINNWPTVRQPWILSADGKTVTYNDDPVKLLRSMPNRASLRVSIADSANVRHEATFRLTRLASIRRKMSAACGWTRGTARRAHVLENSGGPVGI